MDKQSAPPIPNEAIQTLAIRWLKSFTAAARAMSRVSVMKLFSDQAIICGAQKGGPLDYVLSRNFEINIDDAHYMPRTPHVLVAVSWNSKSEVEGGPVRNGDITLYLVAEKTETGSCFVAYHAHFSLA